MKRLYTIRELSKEFGQTMWWWRKRIWNGELPAMMLSEKWVVDVKDVEEMIERFKNRVKE